jgi:uncharacterized protein YlxP (DUF503 family)
MFIGVGRFEIFIPASVSLKDKRHVLQGVLASVRAKFNVSIAEVEYQDLWQRSAFGVSCVSSSVGHCRKVLAEVERAIGRAAADGAEITDRSIDIVALEDL